MIVDIRRELPSGQAKFVQYFIEEALPNDWLV